MTFFLAMAMPLLAFGLDVSNRGTVKRFDSTGGSMPAVNVTLMTDAISKPEGGGMREEALDIGVPVQPFPPMSFAEGAHQGDGDAESSTRVSQVYLPLPVSVKFIKKGAKTAIGVLDRWEIPLEMPGQMAYTFPLVIIVLYSFVWCFCCRRSSRTGLSARMVLEAATCFLCMWADIATKHKVISTTRAWSYVLIILLIMGSWSVADILAAQSESEYFNNTTVFWIFQPLFLVVWCVFSCERMFVRKFLRRIVTPLAKDQSAPDCVAQLCCPQFAALQEAQMMAGQESQLRRDGRNDSIQSQGSRTPLAVNDKVRW